MLNSRPPAAVAGGNVETSSRVADLVFEALAGATEGPAQGQGTMNNLTLAAGDWTYYETLGGGQVPPGPELVATAISNASAHDEIRILADEQAALRRVATLVAKQAPQGEVFAPIAKEMGGLLAVDSVHMVRYEENGVAAVVADLRRLSCLRPQGARRAARSSSGSRGPPAPV